MDCSRTRRRGRRGSYGDRGWCSGRGSAGALSHTADGLSSTRSAAPLALGGAYVHRCDIDSAVAHVSVRRVGCGERGGGASIRPSAGRSTCSGRRHSMPGTAGRVVRDRVPRTMPRGCRGGRRHRDEEDLDPDDFLETPKANLARKAMLEKGYPRRRPHDEVPDETAVRRRQDQRLDAMADRCLAEGDFDQLFKIEMMRMRRDQRNRCSTGSEALELYDEDGVQGRTSLGRTVV